MAALIGIVLLLFSKVWAGLADPNLLDREKTFSIPALRKDKYVGDTKVFMSKAPLRRQDGSAPAHSQTKRIEYTCLCTVGGQDLNLQIDTGSSGFWVYSSLQPPNQRVNHNYFDPKKSRSWKDLSSSFNVDYTDGTVVSGKVGSDTVTIGATKAQVQVIGIAKDVFVPKDIGIDDGLVGLGFKTNHDTSPISQNTFLENAAQTLSDPLFAAYLPQRMNGYFDFGKTIKSRYQGTIQYTPVDSSNGYWQFDSTSYKIGGTVFDAPGISGIADTGTSELLIRDSQVVKFYSSVPGSRFDAGEGGYIFPCNVTLPSISFLVGPVYYATIPAEYLNGGTIPSDSSMCYGNVQKGGIDKTNTYGLPLFYAYYVVFDANIPKIGLASIVKP